MEGTTYIRGHCPPLTLKQKTESLVKKYTVKGTTTTKTEGTHTQRLKDTIMPSAKRAIRIAGSSGGFSDRQRAIGDLAKNSDVDCIIGDWLSECTMTLHGAAKTENDNLRKAGLLNEEPVGLFDPTFMDNLSPALPYLKSKNIKVAVNAGASDTELLAKLVEEEIKKQGLDLKVGWVSGDEVTDTIKKLYENGEEFTSLMTGKPLKEWGHDILCAQFVPLVVSPN